MTTITEQASAPVSVWPYRGVATVHALVSALGLDGEPIGRQAQAVRQFTGTPAWDAAPPVLQRDVRRWLGLLFFSGTDLSITGQALGLAGDDADEDEAPAGDGKTAPAMLTAHRTDDVLHHLARASQRMQAARAASSPEARADHSGHLARHLKHALKAAHGLTEVIRAHYPDEAAELDQVKQAVGLAKAVSGDAKAATTAHLLETTLHELAHARRHSQAMNEDTPDEEWQFNADHAAKHLGGAVEHAGKLAQHFKDNYPDVAKWLNGLGEVTPPTGEDGGKQDGEPQHARYGKDADETITAQTSNGETVSGQIRT
jgi:hypothetical protein